MEDEEKGEEEKARPAPSANVDRVDFSFPRRGYGGVAHVMAAPNSPLAIFRKFNDISMLTLLGLQADILHLRERFCILYKSDESSLEKSVKDAGKKSGDVLESFSSMREEHENHLRELRQEWYSSTDFRSNAEIEQIRLKDNSTADCPHCLLEKIRGKLKEYRSFPDFFPNPLPPV